MKKKKLGAKHICTQCGCKFYDLGKSRPACPQCGVEQTAEAKKTSAPGISRPSAVASIYPTPPKTRHKKVKKEEWEDQTSGFDEDADTSPDTLEDGLTVIQEDELSGQDDT